jgi:hypothetical protein
MVRGVPFQDDGVSTNNKERFGVLSGQAFLQCAQLRGIKSLFLGGGRLPFKRADAGGRTKREQEAEQEAPPGRAARQDLR